MNVVLSAINYMNGRFGFVFTLNREDTYSAPLQQHMGVKGAGFLYAGTLVLDSCTILSRFPLLEGYAVELSAGKKQI